jgi:excisionase family DNA binding protein
MGTSAEHVSLDDLPPTVDVTTAAKLLGVGRGTAYEAARRGEIPTIRIGGRLLVPVSRLRRLLDGEAT